MSNLKALREQINSVKSTQKITSAMKMVAAARLKKAQNQAERARPYATELAATLSDIAAKTDSNTVQPLLHGNGRDQTHLLIVVASDRGLCGAFNTNIARTARLHALKLQQQGKTVKFICIGRKGRDYLRKFYAAEILATHLDVNKPAPTYAKAEAIVDDVMAMFSAGDFDHCTLFYNKFKSAISQIPQAQPLIPLALEANDNADHNSNQADIEYEPDAATIMAQLLPKNLKVQLYHALLESNASEHGARMAAMDNATRNAKDMIKGLTQTYNRSRQALITKELIEIISGAEAL